MNILELNGHLNTGGITSYLYTLSAGLIRRGHQVWVVAQGGDALKRFESIGVSVITRPLRIKSELNPFLYCQLPFLCGLVKREKIDIIHAHTRTTQVLGVLLSFFTGKPLVTTCHGFFKPRWHRRLLGCWGQKVIAISPMVAKHLTDDLKVPSSSIALVNNGVDLVQFRRVNLDLREVARQQVGIKHQRVIGLIARLSDVKGIDILIDAFARVRLTHDDVLLLIVGEGPQEQQLHEQVKRLNIGADVMFKKALAQTAELLPVFDVVIAPSRMEGLGLSVMEAMACGLPVIASRVGGLVNLITDTVDGYLVKPQDPQELASVINAVLDYPQGAQVIGKNARQTIANHFTSDQMVDKTVEVFQGFVKTG